MREFNGFLYSFFQYHQISLVKLVIIQSTSAVLFFALSGIVKDIFIGILLVGLFLSLRFYIKSSLVFNFKYGHKTKSINFLENLSCLGLTKPRIIFAMASCNFISALPLLISLIVLFPFIDKVWLIHGPIIETNSAIFESSFSKYLVIVLSGGICLGCLNIIQTLKTYEETYNVILENKIFIKYTVPSLVITFYTLCFFGISLDKNELFRWSGYSIGSWFFPFVFLVLSFYAYLWIEFLTEKGIVREEVSRFPLIRNYVLKQFNLIIILGIISSFSLFKYFEQNTPEVYRGEQILKIVYLGDLSEVKGFVLKHGESVLSRVNEYGVSSLMIAASEGNFNIYQYLIEKGVFYKDEIIYKLDDPKDGMDLISLALLGGNILLIEQILNSGISANSKNLKDGNTLIHYASQICRADIIELLIERGAMINKPNLKGNTAAHISVSYNCLSGLKVLQEKGINFFVKNLQGKLAMDLIPANNLGDELGVFMNKYGN
jgi:hypothetical protein